MRRLEVYQRDTLVGTLPAPDSFRLPMSDEEIAAIPAMLLTRSRSWLYEVRPGDLKLERMGEGSDERLAIVAHPSLAPGDFGLMAGFEPAGGMEHFAADEKMVDLAEQVRRETEGRRG